MEQRDRINDTMNERIKGGIRWPGSAKCSVMLSFDVDGETLFTEGPQGHDWAWPRSVAYGRFGPRMGVPRILDLLDRKGLKATFFILARIG